MNSAVSSIRSAARRLVAPVVVLAVCAGLTVAVDLPSRLNGNVWSRLLTIESIVERGTLAITDAPLLHNTIDKIKVGDDYYSDKPPTLAAVGALVYWPLHGAGYRLSPVPVPGLGAGRADMVVFWVTWLVVGGSLAVAVCVLARAIGALGVSRLGAELFAGALVACSLLAVYSVTLNNHVVGAALIAWIWGLLVTCPRDSTPGRGRLFGLGLLAGLATAIDMPTGGAFTLGVVVYLKLTGTPWRDLLWCLLGTLGPAAVHCTLQMQATPLPLPAQVQRAYWDYPGSYWNSPVGFDANQEPALAYLGHLLLGPRGWLTLSPVLVWGVCAMVWFAARRDGRWRAEARLALAAVLALVGYYAFGTGYQNYGGHCWGVRWFIAFTPPVLFFCAVWHAGLVRLWRGGLWARIACLVGLCLFWATAAVSFVYTCFGVLSPTEPVERSAAPIVSWLQTFAVFP